jgi:hypothetical protein
MSSSSSSLIQCYTQGKIGIFEMLPTEIIDKILCYVNPDYVYIERFIKLPNLKKYEEVFFAMLIIVIVCRPTKIINTSDLDICQYILRILQGQYYISTMDFYMYKVVPNSCSLESIRQAFQVLQYDLKFTRLHIPKNRSLLFENVCYYNT